MQARSAGMASSFPSLESLHVRILVENDKVPAISQKSRKSTVPLRIIIRRWGQVPPALKAPGRQISKISAMRSMLARLTSNAWPDSTRNTGCTHALSTIWKELEVEPVQRSSAFYLFYNIWTITSSRELVWEGSHDWHIPLRR